MKSVAKILSLTQGLIERIELFSYRKKIPTIVSHIRAKDKIRVLFVLSDLSVWKTEALYKAMLRHSRFDPIIGTTLLTCDSPTEAIRKYNKLIEYLKDSKYKFEELTHDCLKSLRPDITFYQQPYSGYISELVSYTAIVKNGGLVCDVHYALRTLSATKGNSWVIDQGLYRNCWQIYIENEMNREYGNLSILKGRNLAVTGVPMQDELMKPASEYIDPWKPQDKAKKRIIFAPHHTIPDKDNLLSLSCFLDVCDDMLLIVEEFSQQVQFAFKPHPYLKRKLDTLWGKEKADAYYERWNQLDNGQLAEGPYLGLFKHSDALIHDCDSFTLEYCFIMKPMLYLIKHENISARRSDLNSFGKRAFDLHNHGVNIEDIRQFIACVVAGKDSRKEDREEFYKTALMPPNRRLAVDNIIAAILGE